jgi:predicted DNA-binding protein with PD1-like motif
MGGYQMKYFEKGQLGRTIVVRLEPGDDVLGSIIEAIQANEIADGYVASGIGTLDHCVLHMIMTTGYPAVEHFAEWHDLPLELASIDGIIAEGIPHLHTVVSNDKQAWGGHLEPGCRILYLGEAVIQEVVGHPLKRIRNNKNVNELVEVSTKL